MLRRLSSATLAFVALIAQQAQAGVTPAVVSGTHYEQNGTQGCSSTTVCQILFQAPPAGKQVSLDSVACQLSVINVVNVALKDLYIVQNVNGALSRTYFLQTSEPILDRSTNTNFYNLESYLGGSYLVVAPVRIVMDIVNNTSGLTMNCQINGTLGSAPAP